MSTSQNAVSVAWNLRIPSHMRVATSSSRSSRTYTVATARCSWKMPSYHSLSRARYGSDSSPASTSQSTQFSQKRRSGASESGSFFSNARRYPASPSSSTCRYS